MRPWEEVYKFCGDADVIVDDECAEALLWDGGLSRVIHDFKHFYPIRDISDISTLLKHLTQNRLKLRPLVA